MNQKTNEAEYTPTNEPEFFEDHSKAAAQVEQNKVKKKILVPETFKDKQNQDKDFLESKPNETIRLVDNSMIRNFEVDF